MDKIGKYLNWKTGRRAELYAPQVIVWPEYRVRAMLLNLNKNKESDLTILRAALEEIRTNYGHVCQEFETCTHQGCASSCGAWAIADEALRAAFIGDEER